MITATFQKFNLEKWAQPLGELSFQRAFEVKMSKGDNLSGSPFSDPPLGDGDTPNLPARFVDSDFPESDKGHFKSYSKVTKVTFKVTGFPDPPFRIPSGGR